MCERGFFDIYNDILMAAMGTLLCACFAVALVFVVVNLFRSERR